MFFVQKNNEGSKEYENGFRVDKLFSVNVTGIVTARDRLVIDIDKNKLHKRIEDFSDVNFSDDTIRKIFFGNKKEGKYLSGDSRGWSMISARNKIVNNNHSEMIKKIDYRPFDTRFIYYTSDMVDWGREKFMKNFYKGDNIGLILGRQSTDEYWGNVQVSKNMIDNRYHFSYKGIPSEFPLYIYPDNNSQQTIDQINDPQHPAREGNRTPNLKPEIVKEIAEQLGLTFTNEKETTKGTLAPIDILDYIYAVLHSPTYREKYKEFLKIDFPRVPYPKDQDTFWQLVKLGGEVRQIHLLESAVVSQSITKYPLTGTNVVGKTKYDNGKVFINETQYFEGVPEVAWNFYIGGYQPAQKWLKDRKDRELQIDDIRHYMKIIVALTETDRLMKEIDTIEIE